MVSKILFIIPPPSQFHGKFILFDVVGGIFVVFMRHQAYDVHCVCFVYVPPIPSAISLTLFAFRFFERHNGRRYEKKITAIAASQMFKNARRMMIFISSSDCIRCKWLMCFSNLSRVERYMHARLFCTASRKTSSNSPHRYYDYYILNIFLYRFKEETKHKQSACRILNILKGNGLDAPKQSNDSKSIQQKW